MRHAKPVSVETVILVFCLAFGISGAAFVWTDSPVWTEPAPRLESFKLPDYGDRFRKWAWDRITNR